MGNLGGISFVLLIWSLLLDRTLAGFTYDTNSCGSDAATRGAAWLGDVTTMASTARGLLNGLLDGSATPWDGYRTATLLETFFDMESDEINGWLDAVGNNLNTMAGVASTSKQIYVACDDAAFWEMSQDKKTKTFTNPVTQKKTSYSSDELLCADSRTLANGQKVFQAGYHSQDDNVDFVIFCMKQQSGHTPETIGDLFFAEGNRLDRKNTYSTNFFHELCHVAIDTMRGDDAGGEAEGGERYGFTDSVGLRKTYPDQNPDTLMLFSQALELKDWFWDTGFSESPKTRWNKLQGTEAGKETIESEGLTEPA